MGIFCGVSFQAVNEDYRESKKATANFLGSRSLHAVDKSDIERSSAVGRSGSECLKFYFDDKNHKQHVTHNPRSRGLPKSPIRFEIVDDRFRDDGSVKRYDTRKESRGSSKSLDLSNNKDMPSFPIVRHTSELLGDNAPHLRVGNVVKVEKKKDLVNNQVIYYYIYFSGFVLRCVLCILSTVNMSTSCIFADDCII